MTLFSERYGYTKPLDVIIREKMTLEIINAICSCYDELRSKIFLSTHGSSLKYNNMEEYVWCKYLNQRKADYAQSEFYRILSSSYIEGDYEWFEKLNYIEVSINYFLKENEIFLANMFCSMLNEEFIRLNFAYRIINYKIVEVTSEEEIETIETALKSENDSVKLHLNKALELLSLRPEGDYRNSIKESISAVEAFNRTITGASDFNLKKMEKKGIVLPSALKKAFDTLYGYTCDPEIGVRHSLMDVDSDYIPNSEEAIFMLVSCSAFINYLEKKKSN